MIKCHLYQELVKKLENKSTISTDVKNYLKEWKNKEKESFLDSKRIIYHKWRSIFTVKDEILGALP